MRALLDLLFPPRETERVVRKVEQTTLLSLMNPIAHEDGVVSLLPYRDPLVHALIIETKYYDNETAATLLSVALSEYLLERMSEETALERRTVVLIPLPLSPKRFRERGYNQMERVLIPACKELGAQIDTDFLRRARHTKTQTKLSKKERRENVTGAFTCSTPNPSFLYIVVDDVYTTGSTLSEALRTLREAGADRVLAVTLAH